MAFEGIEGFWQPDYCSKSLSSMKKLKLWFHAMFCYVLCCLGLDLIMQKYSLSCCLFYQDEYDGLADDIANSKPEKNPPNVDLKAEDFIVDVTISAFGVTLE